jgi:hypothetical protein
MFPNDGIYVSGNRWCFDLGLKRQNPKYHENWSKNQLRKPLQSLDLGLIPVSQELFFIKYGHAGYKKSSFDKVG